LRERERPDLFFRFLKGRCHGNAFYAKLGYMRSFGAVALENDMQYFHSDLKIFNSNTLGTCYANMMKIDPVTPEITMVRNAPFWRRQQ